MAGFLLPLAGRALPFLGKALGYGATAGGVAMGANWAMNLPDELRKGIVAQGPNADGEYTTSNPLAKLLVNEENTEAMDKLYREREKNVNPEIRARLKTLGPGGMSQWGKGQSSANFLLDTEEEAAGIKGLKAAQKKYRSMRNADTGRTFTSEEEALKAISELDQSNTDNHPDTVLARTNLQSQINERQAQAQHRRDMDRMRFDDKKEERIRLAKRDQLAAQQSLLELEHLKSKDAWEQEKYMHELEYRKNTRRKERTSNLIQALAGLGAAFAI